MQIKMERRALYTYNPTTDDFERYYPSFRDRIKSIAIFGGGALLIGGALFAGVYFGMAGRTEEQLREENNRLRSKYTMLEHRVDAAMKVMEKIRNRDDNFYRVMMQMDPMSLSRRYSGFDFEKNYAVLSGLNDKALVDRLSSKTELLDRQLYSQSQSFDILKDAASKREARNASVPGILPVPAKDMNISAGFGMRRDPVLGNTKFHSGIDFLARSGTPVMASADGIVSFAAERGNSGNSIEINHGNNYLTRYAHLSELAVSVGTEVKRGDIIGKTGNTGKSNEPHLHYEVRFKGEAQNPVNYFFLDLSPKDYSELMQIADDAGQVLE